MITDARPLQPEFVPGDVRHRDGEINALTSTLEPIFDGNHAEPAFLYGPSGTGKTCIARYAADRLCEEVGDVTVEHVSCWEHYTRFKILYRALEGLNRSFDIHRQSTPRDELIDRLRDAIDQPYVLILDEVDQLDDTKVLYDLYRTPGLSLVLIANDDERVFARLDERVASRLTTATRIHFRPYHVDQLVAILEDRVRWGLHGGAATERHLHAIADAAAGDARIAIGTLRAAAKRAEDRGLDQLIDEVIVGATPKAKRDIRQRSLEKLNDHQRVVYEIIEESDGSRPDAIYTVYCERVDDPVSDRTFRGYLQKMLQYNLVEAEGRGKAREYRAIS